MLQYNVSYSQKTDTLYSNDPEFEEIIYYSAKDSIYKDVKSRQVHLYGNAKLKTSDVVMQAGYLMIDLNRKEVFALYETDKDSNRINYPVFSDGTENIKASSIRYNFDTKKGYIEELNIQQDEAYLYMGIAKKQADDQVHFRMGRFTTCNLPEPHYHFQLSRAVFVPEKRIVTGPMNLWVKGVPTPLALPFSVIPQQKKRTKGILFPELSPVSAYGFGFQNLGYYIPVNNRVQSILYANLYSRGSWGLRNNLDYKRRYGYSGNLDIGFQQFKSGFPSNTNQNKFSITWTHRKEAKSNPYWSFGSNVNFISDNNSKNNLDPLNEQYFNNSFNSDINIGRLFPGKPISTGLKVAVRQNSLTKNIALTAPVFNLNVTRFFPFKKLVRGNSGIAQLFSRLGVTYNFEGQNRSNFRDSLLTTADFRSISSQFMNGIYQNIGIQTTTAFFKNTIKVTPNFTYSNKLNFQQVTKTYNSITNSTQTDTLKQTGFIHELTAGVQLTTMLYSYYRFAGKRKTLLRHILTPSVGYRFVPQLNQLVTSNVGVNQSSLTYSPFERSVYSGSSSTSASLVTFGLNNTFELKRKSEKDTVTGFKKTRIIDLLSATGSYDVNRDSMRFSDISLNLRISPFNWMNIVAVSIFSPYEWDKSSGKTLGTYAIFTSGKPGRITQTNLTSSFTFASKESRLKLLNSQEDIAENWTADYAYFALHPEYLLDFTIPWKMTLSHVYSITANQNKSALDPFSYRQIQTLVANGDLSFTQRWKLSANINFDLQTDRITNARFTLSRNMHCWALSFFWTPIGGNKSFLLSIRNTSTMFQDAKIELRKPPVFL
jgi:hypothetical protein